MRASQLPHGVTVRVSDSIAEQSSTAAVPRQQALKTTLFRIEEDRNLFAYKQHSVAIRLGKFAATISTHGRAGQMNQPWRSV
jgi:hypothetical protein